MVTKRKPKRQITEEKVALFIERIRDAVSFHGASKAVGVSRPTMLKWLGKGEKLDKDSVDPDELEGDDLLYYTLYRAHRLAVADLEQELVGQVRTAASGGLKGDWRAAIFILERRYQPDWCLKVAQGRREAVDELLEVLRVTLKKNDYDKVRRELARRISEK